MTHTFTADEFLKWLNDGALRIPLVCEGFAKPIENDREAFHFAPGTSCEEWTKIPLAMVEKVDLIGERSCRDHSHPLVQLHFKESSSKDPAAVVFSSLLRASGAGSTGQHFLMQKEGNDEPPPWIGELVSRIISDSGWFGTPSGGGSGTNVGLNRACNQAMRKCHRLYPYQNISERERKAACEQMEDVC